MTIKPPFFVCGYPRSGTTLLATILNRHSAITIPPETHFYRSYLPQYRNKKFQKDGDTYQAFLQYKRIRDLRLTPQDLALYEPLVRRREDLLEAALRAYADKKSATLVGEKTPAHALYLDEIFTQFDGAKIIYIVRDGRDAVMSNILQSWAHQDPYKQAAEWAYFIRRSSKFVEKYGSKCISLRYEDLVDQTEMCVKRICNFLGVSFESSQLEPSEGNDTVPRWELDWKENAGSKVEQSNAYKWKTHPDASLMRELTSIMYSGLKENSYYVSDSKVSVRRLHFYFPIYDTLKLIGRWARQLLH